MPFIENIWNHKSLSIVGLEKNTGKTECLNYILNRVKDSGRVIALTSIGTDGEGIDQVTQTPKPEIEIMPNMLFATAERHYFQKQLTAEILEISPERTSLGRVVTARAMTQGRVLLSGPAETVWIRQLIEQLQTKYGAELTLVDGALSRLSLASPTVTEAMILATGAALSGNIPELVRQTAFTYTLITLPQVCNELQKKLSTIERGVWAVDSESNIHDLGIISAFTIGSHTEGLFRYGKRLFVAGAVSDKLIDHMRMQKNAEEIEIIAKDFAKIFISPQSYNAFIRRGGKISVIEQPKLLAITVNPVAPNGHRLNSGVLIKALQEQIQVPVYDVRELDL